MKLSEVTTMEEYKNLPKKDREVLGFFKTPPNLDTWELFEFFTFTNEKYPIQYWFRNRLPYLLSFKRLRGLFHRIQHLVENPHGNIRRQVPRSWKDLSQVIEDVNFEIIKAFYLEAKGSYVDWGWNPGSSDFYNWLQDAYLKVTVTIPEIQKDLDKTFPKDAGREFWQAVWDREEELEKMKTEILVKMVEYRGYFWT